MIILNLPFIYPFAIRYLSFCDPILYLSIIGFRLYFAFVICCTFQCTTMMFSPGTGGRGGRAGKLLTERLDLGNVIVAGFRRPKLDLDKKKTSKQVVLRLEVELPSLPL